MSDKINIEEILSKYIGVVRAPEVKSAIKAAIREIVEAVIDKCAEEAKLGEDDSLCNKCNLCHDECIIVDKESILQVKQIIDYEQI